MKKVKNIAIIAFDSHKTDLIEWSYFNKSLLMPHQITPLGFAGGILEGTLNKKLHTAETGKPGEYRQLCNRINNDEIDAVIIFGEADEVLETKDLDAVLEIAIKKNIVVAANRTTADFILHSSLIDENYIIAKNEKKPTDKNEVFEINTSLTLA